jgi:hypothetical protein
MVAFEEVWQRIILHEGHTFHQLRGKPFSYKMTGNSVEPSTTYRKLTRSQFRQAFERMPLTGPGQLQDLQGPSYLYAILTDPRVASSSAPAGARIDKLPEPVTEPAVEKPPSLTGLDMGEMRRDTR